MSNLQSNPFFFKTPENMTPQEVVDLYVEFSNSSKILQDSGHTFIHGHRGCGKSMLFRYASPECQTLKLNKPIKDLPYYGVYLSIKTTELNILEMNRLQNQISGHILSEHFLVVYLAVKTLQSVSVNLSDEIDENHLEELKVYCREVISNRLKNAGWSEFPDFAQLLSAEAVLESFIRIFDEILTIAAQYTKKLSYTMGMVPFTGILLGFQDLLLPLIKGLKKLSFMPNGPIYLFIDDADNLSDQQKEVLNTWVSYRTNADLALKIATQLNYKTYSTVNGQRIESIHDYSEVTISNIYTGRAKDNYPQWVEKVVNKRLELAGIDSDAKRFFPYDSKQEEKIKTIAEEIKAKWKPGESGFRAGDDAYRYARPEYIKSLGGQSKNTHTYIYAGFEQLVHISSGIVRFFLDPASKMISEMKGSDNDQTITQVTPKIQNDVLRTAADELMHLEFDKLSATIEKDETRHPPGTSLKLRDLRNLIIVLGSVFYQYLIDSTRSERRYFSFFVSSEPTSEVISVIKLGIQYGYFYESFVGTKEGRGRTPLYVMTRRLAPYFKLDPVGFAGHKSFTNDFLLKAIENPKSILNKIREGGVDLDQLVAEENHQKTLF